MIKLTGPASDGRYRAVIARRARLGWAYSLKQYSEGGVDIIEALVDDYGQLGSAIFKFTRQDDVWTADDTQPIRETHDSRKR